MILLYTCTYIHIHSINVNSLSDPCPPYPLKIDHVRPRQVRVAGGKDQVTESKYATLKSFTDAYGGWDRWPKGPSGMEATKKHQKNPG